MLLLHLSSSSSSHFVEDLVRTSQLYTPHSMTLPPPCFTLEEVCLRCCTVVNCFTAHIDQKVRHQSHLTRAPFPYMGFKGYIQCMNATFQALLPSTTSSHGSHGCFSDYCCLCLVYQLWLDGHVLVG